MVQKAVFFLLLLLPAGPALAQFPRIVLFEKPDPQVKRQYIRDFQLQKTGRIFLATRSLSFELRSRAVRQAFIQYQPSSSLVMGVGGYYRRLGLEVGFKLPASDSRLEKFGRSRILDWSTSFYGDRFGGDAFFQRYRGYVVRNGYEVDQQWRSGNPYPRYPGLTVFNLGGNVYYVFNHNRFSYRAAFTQMEQQVKSAGSFLLMASGTIMNFANEAQAFIPAQRLPNYNLNDFRYGRFYNLALSPGYGYTFVRDQFYASLSLFMGFGLQHQKYTMGSTIDNIGRPFRKNNFRLAAGYFGDSFYGGGGLLLDNTSIRVKDLVIAANSNSFRIFAGYRF
jgi:hypothetical protein